MPRKRMVLGALEAAVLQVLWQRDEATVAQVIEDLPPERTRHYNTVSTVLTRLANRGLVEREARGRTHVHRALVERDALGREYLDLLKADLFGGSLSRLVSALLGDERPSEARRQRIERLVAEIESGEAGDA